MDLNFDPDFPGGTLKPWNNPLNHPHLHPPPSREREFLCYFNMFPLFTPRRDGEGRVRGEMTAWLIHSSWQGAFEGR
jgi:hypothetical protein